MKIALFLDVDKTLTREFIQQEYAVKLACEKEYKKIEDAFQQNAAQLDYSSTFGEKIVELFKQNKFRRDQARSFATEVRVYDWTPQLLRLPGVDVYLVSSGPNYYVEYLAEKYNIPHDRICCSIYEFDDQTAVIQKCTFPVDKFEKAKFVAKRKDKYDLTIGVGDSPEHDGLFLNHCTIQLMTRPSPDKPIRDYIYIPDLNSVIRLVEGLSQSLVSVDVEQGPLWPKLRTLTFAGWGIVVGTLLAFLTIGLAIGEELGKR